ncbi:hypothetical protein HanRHA438_Chr06g0264631 [Helianthus annuus]|uniref:Uncharacterized protein n=1 Tax=Helianthus annuus TaxID=4232 RepID=A0A251UI22_HELAN|nr:hypothetical protein HanXRQr2_Chr06g0255381 [Helianthus annuus]KAJ0566536.1 hypothetical protein HanIR_Chr06g0274811 [Helianthus annuus]KAJ0911573.1 hypothetical protein HanRHA438_Chr06g0264631 [Helianthus annuus]KAJ0915140.1 hypothetical protein HanPSC8_Chr06g0246541 [Helianthus annuus]
MSRMDERLCEKDVYVLTRHERVKSDVYVKRRDGCLIRYKRIKRMYVIFNILKKYVLTRFERVK